MAEKPTYEELERRVQELEKINSERNQGKDIVQDGQYRWLVENANELILVAQDGLMRFVNQKVFDYLGYSPEELKDRPFIKYIYPEDREKVSERHLKRLKGENLPGVYPFRVVDRDGKVRWMEINAVLSEWNGKPATLNYINDITERKRAEEALRESEKKLTNILNNMTDVVWSISWPDLTYNYFSPSFEKMYGRSEQEFMDNPTLYKDVTHPDDQHLTEKAMKQLVEEGEAVRECRIIKPDGTIVWVNDRSKMIYDENHQPIRVEGVTQDITERKRAEEVLRLSNEQLTIYRHAVDSMEDYKISVVDDNYCYRIVSSQYMKEYNLSEADLVGKSVAELMGQDVFEQSVKPNLDKALQGHAVYYPGWFEIPSKGLRYMEMSYYPLLAENRKSTSVVALIRDITERKQAEEERNQLVIDLQRALANVKQLTGLLPICSHCKKIRDDKGYWNQIESYIHEHSEAEFSHSICQECAKKHYPDFDIYEE
jgi:PAS domain S-box-containing protein